MDTPTDPTTPDFKRLATSEERQAANEKSLDRILLLFPFLAREDISRLLIEATAYPFCDLQYAEGQLRELAERSGGDWRKAIELSYQDLDEAMDNERRGREQED